MQTDGFDYLKNNSPKTLVFSTKNGTQKKTFLCNEFDHALTVLVEELGLKYALASWHLYTHGTEIFYDWAIQSHAPFGLRDCPKGTSRPFGRHCQILAPYYGGCDGF